MLTMTPFLMHTQYWSICGISCDLVPPFISICLSLLDFIVPLLVYHSTVCVIERKEGGVGDLAYPLVSDLKREISQKYQVLNPDGVALRGLFIIDKEVRGHASKQHCNDQCCL